MSYSKNPFLPRARMSAVLLVRNGWSLRQTARHLSVSPGTISKWMRKAPSDGRAGIITLSSKPLNSPNRITKEIEQAIIKERNQTHRCGQVIHQLLLRKDFNVSLSTVHRVLGRHHLTKKYSPWKRRHNLLPRPEIAFPGDLIELDTIHEMVNPSQRMYVYALIDLASRWAYAWATEKINALRSLKFVRLAQTQSIFPFSNVQTDHGSEFSQHFTERIGLPHRHSRVRRPNDNGHVERFNRTLKEECFPHLIKNPKYYNEALKEWLKYYNEQRLHMGINYLTPMEKVHQLFPRS
jgi:transposase InsO family protein